MTQARDYGARVKVLEVAGNQGKWYKLEEARRTWIDVGLEVKL